MHRHTLLTYAERIGFVLMAVAGWGYMSWPAVAPWLMAVGAVAVAVTHLAERYDGTNLRLRRIVRTRHLVGVIYIVTSYFMFRDGMYWVVALLVAVVLELYTLFVISKIKE